MNNLILVYIHQVSCLTSRATGNWKELCFWGLHQSQKVIWAVKYCQMPGKASLHDLSWTKKSGKPMYSTVQNGSQVEFERNCFALLLAVIKPSALDFSTSSSFGLSEWFCCGHREYFHQYEFVELNLNIMSMLIWLVTGKRKERMKWICTTKPESPCSWTR